MWVQVSKMEKVSSCYQWTAEDTPEAHAHNYAKEDQDALPVWLLSLKSGILLAG